MATLNSDPTNDNEFVWDDSKIAQTTHDTIDQKPSRGRRCYGGGGYGSRQRAKFQRQRSDDTDGFDTSFSSFGSESQHRRSSSSSVGSSTTNPVTIADPPIISSSAHSRREIPPLRPSKKQHRRATSLCPPDIPRPNAIKRANTNSHDETLSSVDAIYGSWKENSPNIEEEEFDEEVQSPGMYPKRRYVRARRNSMTCTAPLHKSGSMTAFPTKAFNPPKRPATSQICRRNSMSNMPVDRDSSSLFLKNISGDDAWMNHVSVNGTVSPPKMSRFDSGEFTDCTGSSPGTQSISSSRKRGMSGECLDDADEVGSIGGFSARRTSYANNTASRVCTPKISPASGPKRIIEMSQDVVSCLPLPGPTLKTQGPERRKHVTDLDSESSESECEQESDDESMSEHSHSESDCLQLRRETSSLAGSGGAVAAYTCTEEGILASMHTFDDVKFLIRSLKKQQNSLSKSYIVVPHEKWSAERRKNFVAWSRDRLGFSVRQTSSDSTKSYIQVLRSKGLASLDLLESAADMYKTRAFEPLPPKRNEAMSEKGPIILDTASSLNSGAQKQSSYVVPDDQDETENIAALMGSISLKENEPPLMRRATMMGSASLKEDDPTFTRQVTLEGNDAHSQPRALAFQKDLFPALEAPPAPGRMSLDSVDADFAFVFSGHSPQSSRRSRRPPKLSIGSVNSTASIPRRMDITPMNGKATAALKALNTSMYDNVQTPLMTPCMKSNDWGSRPIEGKDWGCSEECDARVLDALTKMFDATYAASSLPELSPEPKPRNGDLLLDLEAEECESEDYGDDEVEEPRFGLVKANETKLEAPPGSLTLRDLRRRNSSIAKHWRMSVCMPSGRRSYVYQRKAMFDPRQSLDARPRRTSLSTGVEYFTPRVTNCERLSNAKPLIEILAEKNILPKIFGFLQGHELLTSVSLVCSSWADASTDAYAELMLASVGCLSANDNEGSFDDDENNNETQDSIAKSMERSWGYLLDKFPYASFLSEGAFKRVYKVKNSTMRAPEAVSIMDLDLLESCGSKTIVATELAVSVMLSTLARRGICPNFVVTRGVFTCPYEPPESLWGSAKNKNHHVHLKTPRGGRRKPKEPGSQQKGRYQYIRMELCTEGDAEEYIKVQPKELLSVEMSRILLFQISFALHAAASRYCLKHYDLKLLNVFLQDATNVPGADASATGNVVLRYGLGSKNFALRMPVESALIAKLADYGTADVKSESNGQPVTLAQFTTIENTPPDFLILGDAAKQGHSHDLFGLGLCMLHLFTGKAPYEEILNDVTCPFYLKGLLKELWEDDNAKGFSVIRSVVMSDVYKDDQGKVVEGEPDETLYDTLYRYLVLFGIPENRFQQRKHGKVWWAIDEALISASTPDGVQSKKQFEKDQKKYSLARGNNTYIKRARNSLESTPGAMELLLSLVNFDPDARATALDVLNSDFFAPLTEKPNMTYSTCDDVRSFTAFSTI